MWKQKLRKQHYLHLDITIKVLNKIFQKKKEFEALASLSKTKDIVIQKSEKGNSVVIIDKETYIKRMENLLNDQRKFERVLTVCQKKRTSL